MVTAKEIRISTVYNDLEGYTSQKWGLEEIDSGRKQDKDGEKADECEHQKYGGSGKQGMEDPFQDTYSMESHYWQAL